MGPLRARLAQLGSAPFALVAALAAVAAFFAALLLGLATAGTREDLQSAAPQARPSAAPPLVLLGGAAPLPSAPPKPKARARQRPRAARPPAPTPRPARARARRPARATAVPKLLSGTG